MWDGSVGATLKAPFVQTPGGALSGPPGNNHLSPTAPFSFPLRHRGLVNTHHRAPPDTREGTQHDNLEPKRSGREKDGSRGKME